MPFEIVRPSRRVLALFARQKTLIQRRLVNGFFVPAQVCRVRADIIASGAGDYQVRAVSGLVIRVVDPDYFELLDPDPDPGGQKLPTNKKKGKNFHVLKWWMFSCASFMEA
jgi:hypothetical protein